MMKPTPSLLDYVGSVSVQYCVLCSSLSFADVGVVQWSLISSLIKKSV